MPLGKPGHGSDGAGAREQELLVSLLMGSGQLWAVSGASVFKDHSRWCLVGTLQGAGYRTKSGHVQADSYYCSGSWKLLLIRMLESRLSLSGCIPRFPHQNQRVRVGVIGCQGRAGAVLQGPEVPFPTWSGDLSAPHAPLHPIPEDYSSQNAHRVAWPGPELRIPRPWCDGKGPPGTPCPGLFPKLWPEAQWDLS